MGPREAEGSPIKREKCNHMRALRNSLFKAFFLLQAENFLPKNPCDAGG
jgi:hypothetical protein